jgi:formate dehydrogenase maturation protein FdhE
MNSEQQAAHEWAIEDVQLKPCPFCGSDDVCRSVGEKGDGSPYRYVECVNCAATAEPEFWDQRAPTLPKD